MSRHAARARSGSDRTSLYDEITTKIITELEAGRVPWVQPWGTAAAKAPLAMPKNAATDRFYSGINVLILWGSVIEHGFPTQGWLTFRQALGLGGNVRKGERGTTVVYADRFIPDDEKKRARETGEEAQAIPFLKRFTVFNLAQCEGLPEDLVVATPPPEPGLIEPTVEALIKASGVDFRIGGSRAFYMPAHDYVQVPPPQAYFEPINWHRTALHELGHASGAPHRLNRDLSGSFGSKKYAFEELVAEMNAAFCCASLGIVPTVRHADYIGSSKCCARTIAPSSAPPRRRARPQTSSSPFFLGTTRGLPPQTGGRPRDALSLRWCAGHHAKPDLCRCVSPARRVRGAPEEEGCAGLRDGLEAERESFGARRGDHPDGTCCSEDHPLVVARHPP